MQFEFGTGVLSGIRTDVAGVQTPVRFGALQGVAVDFAGDVKELYAMQQYPISTARGKVKITGKAKVAEVRARMYNDLFFGLTQTTGGQKFAFNESTTLGTGAASYTVANSGSTPLLDQGVFLVVDGTQLVAVSSAPGTLQYTFNAATGVYTFNAAQASTPIYANYTYTVATGYNLTLSNPLMGVTPTFKATLMQQFRNQQLVLTLNACISTRLSYPTSVDDYVMQDLDFSSFADDGGNVGTWSVAT
jgi:hypothetical protein